MILESVDSGNRIRQLGESASWAVVPFSSRVQRHGTTLRWQVLWWLGLAVMIAGCATPEGLRSDASPQARQELVARRAEARWVALIKGDMDSAYAYLSPASREVITLNGYKTRIKPGRWRTARVDSVTCEAQVCDVRLVIGYDFRNVARTERFETPLEEKWLLDKGNAWYVYRN